MSSTVVLTPDEIQSITGYTSPSKQLDVLHKRGYVRAFRSRDGQIILERKHFESVCEGIFSQSTSMSSSTSSAPNFSVFKQKTL